MKRGIGLPILSTMIVLAAVLLTAAVGVPAHAQDNSGLVVKVTTDKPVYAPGEFVRILVHAVNLQNTERVLQYPDSKQADYTIDGAYRWSSDKAFLQVLTSVRIPPGATHVFPEFVHKPSDYVLEPGRHEIVADIGYARAATTFLVVRDDVPAKFELAPSVHPNPAPFGSVINFAVSVRNITNQPQVFGHSGCPVLFKVDGGDMPPVACAEYWKQVTLAPGQSVRFGPEEYPYLAYGSHRNAFFLPPGAHEVTFEIPGVGTTSARFQVLPAPGGGAIAGRVLDTAGAGIAGATIQAFAPGVADSAALNTAYAQYQSFSGRDGSYRIDNLPPGRWVIRAFAPGSNTVWHPRAATREEAVPVPVTEGSVTEGIDFVLKRDPVPPVHPGVIFGSVHEMSSTNDAAVPVPNAVVAAFPVRPPRSDADVSTGGPLPPDGPGVYFGFAGATGDFRIEVPYGSYRLIAFAEGHRYQWFMGSETFDKSVIYEVSPNARQAPARFALQRLGPNTAPARIAGEVTAQSPTAAGTVVQKPVPGAEINARPVVLDPRIAYFREVVYTTRSGPDGTYSVEVPPHVPYIVDAAASGFSRQFYEHAPDRVSARPVDVFVGRTTGNIRFALRDGTPPPPPRPGIISGYVYSDNGTDGPLRPLAGAVVRIRGADDFPVPHERITRTDANGRYQFSGLSTASDLTPRYIVSAEADGHVPVYYPGVYQWTTAQPVEPVPAEARVVTNLTLYQPIGTTPYLAVGFVRARHESGVPPVDPPADGDPAGGGTGSGGVTSLEAQRLIDRAVAGAASADGPRPLPGAYFYLVRQDDALVGAPPMAGGVVTMNGTVVVANLQPGVYRAYADRPGFLPGWYGGTDGAGLISVGEGQKPVLADILMSLQFPPPGAPVEDARNRVVRDLHNAPNPFRPQTTIMYRLDAPAEVTLKIYDVTGRLVRTLVDRALQFAGQQTVAWDGRDALGGSAGAGIYFYRVETPIEATVGKMVLAR